MIELPDFGERSVPQSAVDQVMDPIGRPIVNFALLDHKLDILLMAIANDAKQAKIIKKLPHLTGDKISRLQSCFEKLPGLAPLAPKALTALSEAASLNTNRNSIVHGGLSHYISEPEPALVFTRLRYNKQDDIYDAPDEILTIRQIFYDATRIGDVVRQLTAVAYKLHDIEVEYASTLRHRGEVTEMSDKAKMPGHAKRTGVAVSTGTRMWRPDSTRFRGIGLSDRTIQALADCSIDAPERLLFMEEKALRPIPGVGKVGQSEIAAYRAKFISD